MAREVFVRLGGADRQLKFTTREAIALQRRFGKTPKRLMSEDIAPSIEGPKGERVPTNDFNPEVVCAALHLGIARNNKPSEDQVIRWFDDECKSEDGASPVLNQLCDAMMLDGITGTSIDVMAIAAAKVQQAGAQEPAAETQTDGDEGKAVRPPENP